MAVILPSHKKQVPKRKAVTQAQVIEHFNALSAKFKEASACGDYKTALTATGEALRIQPHNLSVLSDYAFCLLRMRDYEKAYDTYMRIYRLPEAQRAMAGPTWLDGLAETCGWLQRNDELRRYGNESLQRADVRLRNGPSVKITENMRPPPLQKEHPERNVIAYTLFGDNPRYCESAIANVKSAQDLFAHWRCRVYLDHSVPTSVVQRLRDAGAQIVDMQEAAQRDGIHPLMWRFLVIDDPNVDRFLLRDADSLLCEREQAAVEEWIQSPCWFHLMRDYFTHTELILAGLWGGCRGALPALGPLMQEWLGRQKDLTRFADQLFLREMVWPTLRQSVMTHDSIFGFHHARPFPPHAPIRWRVKDELFHVGSNAGFQAMGSTSAKPEGTLQSWRIVDENGTEICAYATQVKNGEWRASVPFFVLDPVAEGRWTVTLTN